MTIPDTTSTTQTKESNLLEESNLTTESNVPEQPKETPTQPLESESGNATSGQPSDDLFAFQVSIDGNLISVPCAVKDLETLGYSLGDKAGHILENNYSTGVNMENAAGNYITVGILNTSGSAKTFAECEVDDIFLKRKNLAGQTVVFAKGITFGASEDDIIKAFGEPSKRNDLDEMISLKYYIDSKDTSNAVDFTFWKGELNEVALLSDK